MVRSSAAANAAANARVHHCVNIWGARVIPIVIFGMVGYATWVVVVTLAIDYLIHPPTGITRRTGAGVAIIVLYFFLFTFLATSYIRILQVIITNPGFVPIPDSSTTKSSAQSRDAGGTREEKDDIVAVGNGTTPSQSTGYLDRGAVSGGRNSAPNGLESFYKRDVFECEVDGLPRWCSSCNIWKPDRSHHCREVDRCVYKMDHYCPWAGGIISETSFKFFIQFCVYATIYAVYNLVVVAYFFAEGRQRQGDLNFRANNWIAVIALTAFFGLFAASMAANSIFFALLNTTTVDNLSRSTRTYHFAILLPTYRAHPVDTSARNQDITPPLPYATITYPLPFRHPLATNNSPPHSQPRTFAILATQPGTNPYKLLTPWQNFQAVMGTNPLDWFLPVRPSPNYSRRIEDEQHLEANAVRVGRSMYELGQQFEALCKSANVLIPGGILTDRPGRPKVEA